jgi:sarcosine oxidase subunit gamma
VADHITFSRRSAFAGLAVPGRSGATEGPAGVTVFERKSMAIAQVAARRGEEAGLAEAVGSRMGLTLPGRGVVIAAGALAAVWVGPGRWLVVQEASPGGAYPAGALATTLSDATEGLASVTDQSDARGILRLSGPRARDVLAKGLALDLHPRSFRPGMSAGALCAMIDVTVWQVDDGPTYDIAVVRGYAGSFWHWLTESSAEYGLSVA